MTMLVIPGPLSPSLLDLQRFRNPKGQLLHLLLTANDVLSTSPLMTAKCSEVACRMHEFAGAL